MVGRQYSSRNGKTGHTIPGNYGLCKGEQLGLEALKMAASKVEGLHGERKLEKTHKNTVVLNSGVRLLQFYNR